MTSFNEANMSNHNLRVLIVAEHASARFGGEAALPLHYFRLLRQRQIEAWLIVHERTREELEAVFPDDFDRIYFVPDTFWHRSIWQLAKPLPHRLSYFTVEFVLRLITQVMQRRMISQIIREHAITVIHQPTPVSPKEPSMMFGMSVPVVIGPMNGGMNYPAAFQHKQSHLVHLALSIGRQVTDLLNLLLPGKRQAAALLVANSRTRRVLPKGVCHNVIELAENGVDLSIWRPSSVKRNVEFLNDDSKLKHAQAEQKVEPVTKFVYVGRLIDWKAVDLLLIAFQRVAKQLPVTLEIIGDGPERIILEQQAKELGLTGSRSEVNHLENPEPEKGTVRFVGWLSQPNCAKQLQQADVMVLPSLLECGGAAVLEAMTMELPVIAAKWGGPASYLDESCGILVEPSSQERFISELAAAMTRMAKSPQLRRAMGRAGRRRVLNYFDWEVKMNAVLEIYRKVVEATAESKHKVSIARSMTMRSART